MCNLARKVTHARKRNPWADCDELLHRCKGPRRNHLCQFLWFPRTGFERGGGGQILGFSIDLHRRPYNTLALPCECVMFALWHEPSACRLSVCLSVCRLWRCCALRRGLNFSAILLHYLIAYRDWGSSYENFGKKIPRSSKWSCKLNWRSVWKIGFFRTISRFISKTIQDTAIVTMEDKQECHLSSDAIFNDLEQPLTHISRSRQCSTCY